MGNIQAIIYTMHRTFKLVSCVNLTVIIMWEKAMIFHLAHEQSANSKLWIWQCLWMYSVCVGYTCGWFRWPTAPKFAFDTFHGDERCVVNGVRWTVWMLNSRKYSYWITVHITCNIISSIRLKLFLGILGGCNSQIPWI